ncbi:MATE family efflux transporter [Dermabacteraceae bacterium TAE3-ERU27]|nr:MATE family efflux transporter [Dermabacteraceae bacterium TAE3-ERU27]
MPNQNPNREILRLAVPALGALIAEPLFLLADTAIVGHVSTPALAGLALASTVLSTVVGLSVFLAYSTTAAVSRALGAGETRLGLSRGMDSVWLSLLIGSLCALACGLGADVIIGWFGAGPEVKAEAVTYLRVSALGLPAMLLVLAATGLVRGMQDTLTPLLVSVIGAALNVPLNYLLVFPAGLGIAGSAIGTVLVQWGMALTLGFIVVRAARRAGARLRPHLEHLTSAWRESVPLLVRTISLRVVLITMSVVALRLGSVELAAHQVAMSVFNLFALALDSLAIAGQALTGKFLGAGNAAAVRRTTNRLMLWGIGGGVITALVLLAASFALPGLFSPDRPVQEALLPVLLVLVMAQPLAGFVFVLDGVLMGAGDAPFLARASALTMIVFMPGALALVCGGASGTSGLIWLWIAYSALFLGTRALTLGYRARGDAWMRLGQV